jgi:hypothetical protein
MSRSSIVLALALTAAIVLACAREGPPVRDDSARDTVAAPVPTSATGDSVAPGAIVLRRERDHDLTGDGRPERLRVIARGPGFQSLDVRLEIRGADERLLYLARWNAERYFHYDGLAGKADSTIERIVRGHVDRLLADTAFVARVAYDPRGRPAAVDTEAVRYDLAEMDVRRRRGVADTMPSPTNLVIHVAEDSGGVRTRADVSARVRTLATELATRPRFTYFAGGEETYSLAWSDSERRFVRVFACC